MLFEMSSGSEFDMSKPDLRVNVSNLNTKRSPTIIKEKSKNKKGRDLGLVSHALQNDKTVENSASSPNFSKKSPEKSVQQKVPVLNTYENPTHNEHARYLAYCNWYAENCLTQKTEFNSRT